MVTKTLAFAKAVLSGIWQEIKDRFGEDISGQTLNEYMYVKYTLRPDHPLIAHLLDISMAYVLRPMMYWIAFGVIFLIGPWAFVLACLLWRNWIAAFIAFNTSVFIDYIFIWPYLKSKAKG